MGSYVYISYRREDRAYVDQMAAHLTAAGVPVWYDPEPPSPARFAEVVQPKIVDCAAVLSVAPFAAIGMGWVRREVDFADSLGKPLFSLLLTEEMALFRARPEIEQVPADQMPGTRFVDLLRAAAGGPVPLTGGMVAVVDVGNGWVGAVAPDLWTDAEITIDWSDADGVSIVEGADDEWADRGAAPPEPAGPPPPAPQAVPAGPPPPAPQAVPAGPPPPAPMPRSEAPTASAPPVAPLPPAAMPTPAPRPPAAAPAPAAWEPPPPGGGYGAVPAGAPPMPAYSPEIGVPQAAVPGPRPVKERLAFTAAYPSSVTVAEWHPLLVLLHTDAVLGQVEAVLQQWAPRLGGSPVTSMATASTGIARGTTISLVPSAEGVVFNPERVDVAWQEDVQEVPFRMQVQPGAASGVIPGRIDVLVGTLPVAIVSIGLDVGDDPTPDRPQQTVSSARMFERVFASYSRHDQEVVLACTSLYQAMGVTVLVDQADLQSGDDWRSKLHRLIDEADIFQLYWSTNSSASSEVGNEWHYALSMGAKGPRFIRPVYWESPMPTPPAELAHVHFSQIDLRAIGHLPGHGATPRRSWFSRLFRR